MRVMSVLAPPREEEYTKQMGNRTSVAVKLQVQKSRGPQDLPQLAQTGKMGKIVQESCLEEQKQRERPECVETQIPHL